MRSFAIRAPARAGRGRERPERKYPNEDEAEYARLRRWVAIFSWIIAGGVAWGIFLSHALPLFGYEWGTCKNAGCTLTFHLFEVPIVSYDAFLAYYGLRRFARVTERVYAVLLGLANAANVAFFVTECQILIQSLNQGAMLLIALALLSVCLLLVSGVGLGLYTQLRLTRLFDDAGDPRYEHPASERALRALVRRAREEGLQVRVRGAGHSVYAAIHADGVPQESLDISGGNLDLQLDRYTNILHWDDAKKQVTVEAGCHLGIDPADPLSRRENSLLYQLEQRGWALPDLGGITHQTVGGFLSTGSQGGTTTYDLAASIVKLRLIGGDGKVHEFAPNPNDPLDEENNPFYAAGVSLGLLGVLSTVTFQCEERFDIIGKQVTSKVEDCGIELFGDGENSLRQFMDSRPYSRLLWWPQKNVEKLQVWEARRTRPEDQAKTHRNGRFVPKPFVSVPTLLGLKSLSQSAINAFYTLISREAPPYEPSRQKFVEHVMNSLLDDGTEEFWDSWHEGLPMDNAADDELLPTEFTELFIDIDKTSEVMRALRDFFGGDVGMERTGAYAVEIYPARRSRFWLSPSYGRDCVRVDIFWFKTRKGNPDTDFYPQYWELLKRFDFRFHWGKYLSAPDSSTGAEYRRKQFPRWEQFMALRQKLDPDDTFLTLYWREHLGLADEGVEEDVAPLQPAVKEAA